MAAYASRKISLATNRQNSSASIQSTEPIQPDSVLHPRVAVLLGVAKHWHLPLLLCRALSTVPAIWWSLRCAIYFISDVLSNQNHGHTAADWNLEQRLKTTELFLAFIWVWLNSSLEAFTIPSRMKVASLIFFFRQP